jgi:hypothetical protein
MDIKNLYPLKWIFKKINIYKNMFTKILKNKKIIILIFLFSLFLSLNNIAPVSAALDIGMERVKNIELAESDTDPRDIIINIVKYFMTFLGIVAVCMILYGGYIWMTAVGNEDKVSKAKQIIVAGLIGMIIILSAYVIVDFILDTSSTLLNGEEID